MNPNWNRYIREHLPSPGLRPEREEEIIEELSQHLEAVYDDAIAGGASRQEAFAKASAVFKDWQYLECELAREERNDGGEWRSPFGMELSHSHRRKGDWFMRSIMRDLRFGLRVLLKSPGFLAAAVLSLALGIGANTAIFSVIDAVLLKMLPVDRPEGLHFIQNVGVQGEFGSPPYPCFERFRDQNKSFVGMAAFTNNIPRVMTIDGQQEEMVGQRVSGNYFSLLGVGPALGRVLTREDDAIAGQGGRDGLAAVISYRYWTRRFGQNPAVIGESIKVGDHVATIVGVIRPDYYGLNPGTEINVYLPIASIGSAMLSEKKGWWFQTVGRLKPGVTAEQARAELDPIFQSFMNETGFSAEARRDRYARIELPPASRGLDSLRRQYSRPLQALMAIVGLTLLIACANVANLLLARATARRKEFALRLALGARRGRLIQQLLIESMILVGFGAVIGLALARWGSRYLTSFFATGRNRIFIETPLDIRILLFTVAVALLTGLLFGLAPAIQAARVDPNPALKEGGGGGRLRFGSALIVSQITLSMLLLISAGLFLRTLRNLKSVDAGFETSGVLSMQVNPPEALYQGPRRVNLWNEILERVRRLPGVESATLSSQTPLDGTGLDILVVVAGFTPKAEWDRVVSVNRVSTGFLSTLKIPLIEGRDFDVNDNEASPKVALINESAAKFYFAGRSAIGGQFKPRSRDITYQVVGVVKDIRYSNLRTPDSRRFYLPTSQAVDGSGYLRLSVRANIVKSEMLNAVRNEINAAGSGIFINKIVTLEDQLDQSLLQERLVSRLSIAFGALGLILAAIGLFGVLSYDVARRTHEIGVRMALGARAVDVVQMVMRQTTTFVATGVALGLVASFIAAKFIASLLFGMSAKDPLVFTIAAILMLLTAAVAVYMPARRASRVDPLIALRVE